jgi:hypothetical protein
MMMMTTHTNKFGSTGDNNNKNNNNTVGTVRLQNQNPLNSSSVVGNSNQSQQQQHQHQQPNLLRSWGAVRWTQDRALYHGGAPVQPQLSFMCDDTKCWTCDVDDVKCANPGSFAVNGVFAWISPTDKTVEFNELQH